MRFAEERGRKRGRQPDWHGFQASQLGFSAQSFNSVSTRITTEVLWRGAYHYAAGKLVGSPYEANRALAIVSAVWNWAARRGEVLLAENPAKASLSRLYLGRFSHVHIGSPQLHPRFTSGSRRPCGNSTRGQWNPPAQSFLQPRPAQQSPAWRAKNQISAAVKAHYPHRGSANGCSWLALIGATGQKKVKLAHSQTANGIPLAYDSSNELM